MVSQDGLDLEASVTADEEHLFLRYTVKNTEATTAYLLNVVDLPDDKGVPRVHKDNAYVYVGGADSEVHVQKDIPEIPRGAHPYEPVTPYMTALRPGASFEETVELRLPIRDTRPYRGGPPGDAVMVSQVRFSLGYLRVPEGTRDWPLPEGGAAAVQFETPPGTRPKAGTLMVKVPVRSTQTGDETAVPATPPIPPKK